MKKNRLIVTLFTLISISISSFVRAEITSSTSPCFAPPLQTAHGWKDTLTPPVSDEGFANPAKNCPKACKKWTETCLVVSEAAAYCLSTSIFSSAKMAKTECRTIADQEAKRACIGRVREDIHQFKEFLSENKHDAKEFCVEEQAACVTQCLEDTGGDPVPY